MQVTRSVAKKQKRLKEKADKLLGVKNSPDRLKSDIRKLKLGVPLGTTKTCANRGMASKVFDQPCSVNYQKSVKRNFVNTVSDIAQKEELLAKAEGFK